MVPTANRLQPRLLFLSDPRSLVARQNIGALPRRLRETPNGAKRIPCTAPIAPSPVESTWKHERSTTIIVSSARLGGYV